MVYGEVGIRCVVGEGGRGLRFELVSDFVVDVVGFDFYFLFYLVYYLR